MKKISGCLSLISLVLLGCPTTSTQPDVILGSPSSSIRFVSQGNSVGAPNPNSPVSSNSLIPQPQPNASTPQSSPSNPNTPKPSIRSTPPPSPRPQSGPVTTPAPIVIISPPPVPPNTGSTPSTSPNSPGVANGGDTVPATLPDGFRGVNTGIGSWFNSVNDGTNGHSWCGYPYTNDSNGFAPDITVMTSGTNAVYGDSNYESSARTYCGLEAKVTDPATGITKIMYIIDAFDHQWVRAPGSIDIMNHAWSSLTNEPAVDKNNVIQGVTWEFTGKRSLKYSFGGPGDP